MRPERKVLMLTWYAHIGGLERMVLSLSTALKAGGWSPRAFVFDRRPDAGPENDLTPSFESAGVPVVAFEKGPGFSFGAVAALRRLVAEEAVPVLHSHDLGALMYGACVKLSRLGRARLIHTQHSFVGMSAKPAHARYQRFFTRFADEIVVVSEDTKRSYVELGVPERRIRVIPNGVRFPERSAGAAERRGLKAALLAALDAPARAALEPFAGDRWILYMARLEGAKGQDHALELWERLSPAARAGSVLLFVGPESETGALARLRAGIAKASDASRVLALGATHAPELWLGCSDVALSCSEFEGMPLGPIEAAGAGLPLVLSEIPGHAVLRECSVQYRLDAPADGARAVERLLAAAPDESFARAWENAAGIRSRHTLARMSEAYARLYVPEVAT
jgi:glycosyltransferase involved in cell wall biosynthesis